MKYELRIPATCGDVIPLIVVASEMARAASAAYGKTLPHDPIYNGRLPMCVKLLLIESRAGRLRVCNQFEHQGSAEELLAAAKSSGDLSEVSRYLIEPDWEKLHQENAPILPGIGVWDFTGIDLGPKEVDWDSTNLGCLYAKLHHLNEWGRTNDDEFVISSDGVEWIDERGVMVPTAVIHSTKKRRDSITPAIEHAQSKCKDPSDTAEVWAQMEVLAENEVPPFQARMVEGLKYTKKGKVCYFTRDALRLRLHPEFRAPRK